MVLKCRSTALVRLSLSLSHTRTRTQTNKGAQTRIAQAKVSESVAFLALELLLRIVIEGKSN